MCQTALFQQLVVQQVQCAGNQSGCTAHSSTGYRW
jgi:hypothetical protein